MRILQAFLLFILQTFIVLWAIAGSIFIGFNIGYTHDCFFTGIFLAIINLVLTIWCGIYVDGIPRRRMIKDLKDKGVEITHDYHNIQICKNENRFFVIQRYLFHKNECTEIKFSDVIDITHITNERRSYVRIRVRNHPQASYAVEASEDDYDGFVVNVLR